MPPRKRLLRAALAVHLCLLLSGCALSPLARRTASFSSAAAAASNDSANAYQVVEGAYYRAQVSALVVAFDKTGFDRTAIQPFMPEADMQARTDILNALHSYAELLAQVSGNQPIEDLDKQTQVLATSLNGLSKDQLSSWVSPQQVDLAVTALNALGRVLIERKRKRELPGILAEMKGPIENICDLLEKDIGDREHSGLRNQLSNSYSQLIRKQQQYIRDNEKSMSPGEKRAEIERLPGLVAAGSRADRALARTQAELADLAKAHTSLAESVGKKDSPGFRLRMAQLLDDSRQLKAVYESLEAK
jgi:hypothetical protein